MKSIAPLFLASLLLGSCREQEASAPPIDAGNPIEMAAREANLVEDPDTSPPTGLYERRHSSGRDAVCITPAGLGSYRFGLIASFGTELICQGQGSATQDGAALKLSFKDAACEIEAVYDGRTIRLPGTVPEGCADICGPRATIAGVSVTRVGWSEADAISLKSRREADKGQSLCGG